MSTRLSHKALKTLGKNLNGYYFNGNIYDYQNKVHQLTYMVYGNKPQLKDESREYIDFIIKLERTLLDKKATRSFSTQIAHSAGVCGNTGQLHQIQYYNEDNAVVETIYTYV